MSSDDSRISTASHGPEARVTVDQPEFTILAARGTLKIPLSTSRSDPRPPLDVPAVQVERGHALPVVAPETASRAIAPAPGATRCACEAMLFGRQVVPAVEFVCDSNATEAEQIAQPVSNLDHLSLLDSIRKDDLGAWIERLRDAGIYADRRSSPDLITQLIQSMKRPVDTVLCTLLDSDPTACLNAAIACQFPDEVLAGTMLIARLIEASTTMLCADHRVPGAWLRGIRKRLHHQPARLITMTNDYPQPDPTLLLYTLFGRRLRPGRLPVEQGVLLLDAAAAFSLGRRFLADEPMTHVPLAVRDHIRRLSHFMLAPIGLPICDLLSRLGEITPNALVRGGDLLRDIHLSCDAVVSGAELALHICDPEPDINPDACIRCGWCIEACPTRVQPAVILEAAQADDLDIAEGAGIDACIECGICSYVCPSKLPLLEGIRGMKGRYKL